MINIDKCIPIPTDVSKYKESKFPFSKLKVGDSFLYHRYLSETSHFAKKLKIKCVQRKVQNGFRVWRIA